MFKGEREYVKKRKSYYGFAKNYPGKLGSSKYVIGESRAVKKRETLRSIIIALIIVLIFIFSFVFTSVCLNVSEKEPINQEITQQAEENNKKEDTKKTEAKNDNAKAPEKDNTNKQYKKLKNYYPKNQNDFSGSFYMNVIII